MKISRHWLQSYFETTLPSTDKLEEALTFHAFEIDGVETVVGDDVLDVKVTPNRGHDCLCHRGIARELSAILKLQIKTPSAYSEAFSSTFSEDPSSSVPSSGSSTRVRRSGEKMTVSVSIDTPLCHRYIAGYMKGVKVGPSPEWLKSRLEALGQRSINNVVDATNYVMFDLGQPLHAFDAGKLTEKDGSYAIAVRPAHDGEVLLALDEKKYTLGESNLAIVDANKNEAVGIAGVKGGMPASITTDTTDIIIESANFDGVSVRRTAQALKLRTDASTRFEQVISPELAAEGMRAVIDLIQQIAGGEVIEVADVYPNPQPKKYASVTVEKINKVLGITLTGADVADVFQRLGLGYKEESGVFEVSVPPERLDLIIPEDLVEEVGRIYGYDHVPATELPAIDITPEVNPRVYAAEHAREDLLAQGYSEVLTSVFADKGERVVLNKVDGVRPYLRDSLLPGLTEALKKNISNKDLLNLKEVKLFEVGTVWKGGKEITMVGTVSEKQAAREQILEPMSASAYEDLPTSSAVRYQPFSRYPYIVRDVAVWVPSGIESEKVGQTIVDAIPTSQAHQYVWNKEFGVITSGSVEHIKGSPIFYFGPKIFDRFEKGERVSLAFRLIFQSFERTLTDDDANTAMERVYEALRAQGFEIR